MEDTNFFVQKALEGYEVRIKALEKQFEELGNVLSSFSMALQSSFFQNEVCITLLLEKGLVSEAEAKEVVDRLGKEMEEKAKAAQGKAPE